MSARLEPASFLRKATDVASFYGFRSVREIETAIPPEKRMRRVGTSRSFEDVARVCVACTAESTGAPTLCFSINTSPEKTPEGLPVRETGEFGLQLIGSPSSLGDIVVLKTLMTILRECGTRPGLLRLNALGDRESQMRYGKELSLYVRKRGDDIPEALRSSVFSDPFALFTGDDEELLKVATEAPRPLSFLSDKSRLHLKEILENLEHLDVPYTIDDRLKGDECAPRFLFTIDLEEESGLILRVTGGRYDEYIRKITGRKEGMGVRASVYFRKKGIDRRVVVAMRARAPRIYFVQLGNEAKLRSLGVLEILRRARIPVYQSFETDRLGPQLSEAEKLKVPYLLIMGHKEALEGAIIVRSVANRSQEVVPFGELPRYLRHAL